MHFYVDEEFERGRFAAVAELQHAVIAPVLGPLQDAFKHHEARPQDAKASIAIYALGSDCAHLRWLAPRSEERRVGKECTVLCRSRWSPYH